ncbi:hypothetical protein D3C73_1586910 [compost metagenome]
MYEELMTEEESGHALENDEMFIIRNSFIMTTSVGYGEVKKSGYKSYSSYGGVPISTEGLKKLLQKDNLLFPEDSL